MRNPSTKRILTFLLALVLVLAVCPAPISATETEAPVKLCPCCGQDMDTIQWKALPADATPSSGHYRATENGTMLRAYSISTQVTVDLNGCALTTLENERAFYVYSNKLTVLDSVGTGSITTTGSVANNGGVFFVRSGSTLDIYGGTFVGCELASDEYGGGAVRANGTVNMYGGTLTGGKAHKHGGNVSISSGVFNLYGGTVSGGQTFGAGRGGNFYLTGAAAQLNIYDGTVTGGISAGSGGSIYAYSGSSVSIYGGTVENGVSANGEGQEIYIIGTQSGKYSTLDIYGGIIGDDKNDILQYNEHNAVRVFIGSFGQDPTQFFSDCA